ncbi:MAG: hypothetical protein Fur0011_1880 [Candidatus Microgenomates bacterium]
MNEVKTWWDERMSEPRPSLIFALLQLIFGRRIRYEGAEIYAGNQDDDDSHIET